VLVRIPVMFCGLYFTTLQIDSGTFSVHVFKIIIILTSNRRVNIDAGLTGKPTVWVNILESPSNYFNVSIISASHQIINMKVALITFRHV
jgi:hypothetical protein